MATKTKDDEDGKFDFTTYLEQNKDKINLVQEIKEEIIDENGIIKIIINRIYLEKKLCTYTETAAKSIKEYQIKHKDKINEYQKNIYKQKYNSDPEFREREKERNRKYREKKKLEEKGE